MLKKELLGKIEAYILDNEMKPGDRLPGEVELSERFNVSRGTLREVVSYLVLKGILERKTSQGTILRTPDFAEIAGDLSFQLKLLGCGKEELRAGREILELSIIPSIIRYATPRHLDHLTRINDAMLESQNDRPTADKHDLEFHKTLFDIVGNRILKLFASIVEVQFEGKLRPPFWSREAVQVSAKSHCEIIRAISERNGTEMTRLILEHVKQIPD